MKIIKKSNICSYKANDELLANERIDGLHFTTRSGFTFDSKAIDKHIRTRKPIIYRTENDEMSSIDYTMFCLTNFTRKFPNIIVSLSDTEMTLYIQEMLRNEGVDIKTAKGLHQRFPDAKIFNTYGPTETTVAVSGIEITPEIIENNDRLPVGYAKPGVKLSIWNGNQEITTPGEQGEIVISGNSVAHGYMNNPEKTAKSFFKIDGVPAYRTGDAGTLDSDGLLHHKGRMDFQIKLHGYRIELDEVRASLEKSPLIKQAVAVPKYNKDGKVTHLIAYVIPNEATEDTAGLTKQIRESLDGLIMPYMMPTQFVYRESFPMSANGKIAVKQMIAEANK